ncbi:MAG: T9SS type A sorting domain-containing protein, partial [Paludibacter sp.]|nr:T9SS type A sorting domain-containing protein [Paludibacter sp.]
ITVQINGWTGINDINFSAINAWTINGALYVSGLSAGERYSIYTVSGVCLAQGTAVSGDAQYLATLPMRGVYILQTSHGAVKVLN